MQQSTCVHGPSRGIVNAATTLQTKVWYRKLRARSSGLSGFPEVLSKLRGVGAERAYPNLVHYNELAKGGHFAAWEQPKLFFRRASRGLQITAHTAELNALIWQST